MNQQQPEPSRLDYLFERVIPERFLQSKDVFVAKTLWVYSVTLGVLGLLVLLVLSLAEGQVPVRRLVTVCLATLFLCTPILIKRCQQLSVVSGFVFTSSLFAAFYIDFNNQSIDGPTSILWVVPALLAALCFKGKSVFILYLLICLLVAINVYLLKNNQLPSSIVQSENWPYTRLAYLMMVGVLVMICTWGVSKLANRHFFKLNNELKNKQDTILKIKELQRKAEVAAHSKSMFLATMSHELRTPLNSVIGNAQLLSRADLPKKHHDRISDIAIGGNLLLMLINDILDYSKLEEGELQLIEEPYDLNKQIIEITRMMQPRLNTKVVMNHALPAESIYINGDQNRIAQVVMNLLSNAIKFTEQGEINIHLSVEGQQVSIAILDTGIGIAEKDLSSLFNVFTQVSHDSKINMQGTGLGLAISLGLINQMGGRIEVDSTLGEGSCFTIVLPNRIVKIDNNDQPQNTHAKTDSLDLSNQSILVVDDIAMNCAVLEDMLLDLKANNIVSVNSGMQALKYIADNPDVQIILMDMRMPEMDGIEATRLLRKSNFTGKVIAVTANASKEDKSNCLAAGMDEFISKPIVIEDLQNTLIHVLK